MGSEKLKPKPVRLWAMVNRSGRVPYVVWSVLANRRADIEFHYLYWSVGFSNKTRTEEERQRFRDRIALGELTIERVTLTPEAR